MADSGDGASPRVHRDNGVAAASRPGLVRINARPPDTAAACQLYVSRACDVFLPGDDIDAHRAFRWP